MRKGGEGGEEEEDDEEEQDCSGQRQPGVASLLGGATEVATRRVALRKYKLEARAHGTLCFLRLFDVP
jgi:hypothetical protein